PRTPGPTSTRGPSGRSCGSTGPVPRTRSRAPGSISGRLRVPHWSYGETATDTFPLASPTRMPAPSGARRSSSISLTRVTGPGSTAPMSSIALPRSSSTSLAPAWGLAALLGGVYMVLAPPSADLAAQAYRSGLGLVLWDGSWYGGHHMPGYSVLF